MRRSELLSTRIYSIGILVWLVFLTTHSEALRGSAVVLQAKSKPPAEPTDDANNANGTSSTNSTKLHLTGIPQIDYIHDPNLPRELNGHNLTDYPFYNSIPEEIDFKCDGLHDGFYASVAHKCQVYHHCLYGYRYDFLCANYTAFDQKTFICHFVSEVDCNNSPKHFKRNEELYKEATTTTTSTTTTTTTTTTARAVPQPAGNGGNKHSSAGRRRRPFRRRRPMYEYYYEDEEYADPEYYDDEVATLSHRRASNRKQNKDSHDNHDTRDPQDAETADYEEQSDQIKPLVRTSSGSASSSVYDRPRAPPKIRRPVPKSERDKYDYIPKASSLTSTIAPTEKPTTTAAVKKVSTTTPAPAPQASDDEYYEDDEYEYEEQRSVKPKHQPVDYDFPTAFEDTRRYVSRPHRNRQPARKRTDIYDDYDLKERSRMNRRKEYSRYDDRPRGRPMYRNKNRPDDHGSGAYMKNRRRIEKRPVYDDDYYYDEEEEVHPKRNRRPQKTTEKPPKSTTKATKIERTTTEAKPTESTTRHSKQSSVHHTTSQRSAKLNGGENETTKENDSARTTQKYNMYKIINNVLSEDADDNADYMASMSTEETRSSSTPSRPTTTVVMKPISVISKNEPKKLLDEMPNKTITTIRHFVIAPPVRKPSQFGYVNAAPVTIVNTSSANFREEAAKLPEQRTEFFRPSQYIKIPVPLYTNAISFPQRSPPNYDITAPGPSAPAEETNPSENKYSKIPAYTANTDYDVTYNDALQPSTLYPVRRFPSTSFYIHSPPRRQSSELAFNDSAFKTLNRSQSRYTSK